LEVAKKTDNTSWWDKIWNDIKSHWKPIAWGVGPILIVVIIFSLPIKTAAIQTTEQYWDTEMKSEPYTASESYTEQEPYTTTETRTATIYDSYVSNSWSQTFNVDKPNTTVTVNFYGSQYYYQPTLYCTSDNVSSCNMLPNYPYYYGQDYFGGLGHATIKIAYPEEVTKYRTVTKYRDVTKYREVPTQVLKERTVTTQAKMSIWAYLFR
jgi:hypothetical protein